MRILSLYTTLDEWYERYRRTHPNKKSTTLWECKSDSVAEPQSLIMSIFCPSIDSKSMAKSDCPPSDIAEVISVFKPRRCWNLDFWLVRRDRLIVHKSALQNKSQVYMNALDIISLRFCLWLIQADAQQKRFEKITCDCWYVLWYIFCWDSFQKG